VTRAAAIDENSELAGGAGSRSGRLPLSSLALHERLVLADQQVEMVAFFVGEFEEYLFAVGVLEPLAVLLEEAV
jgi:hypothetical protein